MIDPKPPLQPDHGNAAWDEFCEALWRAIAPGRCMGDGAGRHYFARWLLAERGYDVEASLTLYETKGGYCDCEILLNVDAPMHDDRELPAT